MLPGEGEPPVASYGKFSHVSSEATRRHGTAEILGPGVAYASGERVSAIALSTGLTRMSVGKWIDRALVLGVATDL